jgi:glycosyltransferase involved in cell wall biosynthesis
MGTDRLSRLRTTTINRLRRGLGIIGLEHRVASLENHLGALGKAYSADVNRVWELLDGHEERIARVELQVRIATVMAWIEQATPVSEPLVSVVMATRDRAAVLPRAIESVLGQSFPNWELLVCDDGSGDGTAAVVGSVADPRVRHMPAKRAGVGAARNRGLDAARGELIAYLDDDNRMHPNWLKSVVWAFEQRPEAELLYGAIVIDDTARHHGERGAEMPSAWLERYDPEAVIDRNVADTSAIAHRARLVNARWDEDLKTMGDWDFILRATADRDPLTLPAIACFYYSDAADRLTDLSEQSRLDRPRIVDRARAARSRA